MSSDYLRPEEAEPEAPPSSPRSAVWGILALAAVLAAIALLSWEFPLLRLVLLMAVVLAAASLYHTARRRAMRAEFFGRPAQKVTIRTYLWYLAAWFAGLLAVAPLLAIAAVAAVIALVILGAIIVLAAISALFGHG